MDGFMKSFFPISKRLRKFRLEFVLLFIACTVTAFIFFLLSKTSPVAPTSPRVLPEFPLQTANSLVDISGAVQQPGVYEVSVSARLRDVIILAGGLSDNADKEYFARNYNLAKFVFDQEKIHIPSFAEIQTGLFIEPQHSNKYPLPTNQQVSNSGSSEQTPAESDVININSASIEELDVLPGIGAVTSQKIIQNRPYRTVEELLTKKVIKQNIYDQIKDFIVLN